MPGGETHMRKASNLALSSLAFILIPVVSVWAQSVTVAPSMPYVGVKGKVQFSATLTGPE